MKWKGRRVLWAVLFASEEREVGWEVGRKWFVVEGEKELVQLVARVMVSRPPGYLR